MQAGVTAALWFGPAQEFSRYWIAGDEPRLPRGVIKTLRRCRVDGIADQRY